MVLIPNIAVTGKGSYERPAELISILKAQVQQKDEQIDNLQEQLMEKSKAIEDARQRSDAIILQLTQQLEDRQKP
jgi:vacuolar-type H+-ATPase subunit H